MVKNKFVNYYNSEVKKKKKIESHLFQLELVNRLNEVFELVFLLKKFFLGLLKAIKQAHTCLVFQEVARPI